MSADWLADAVLYEIYPQSFADSDGDGIGDLRGVIDRLDHLELARRRHDLVQPVLRLAVRRRGLRRLRLPAHRPALRHQRRPGRARRQGPRARHPGAARPGRRPHLGRAPVVPGRARRRRAAPRRRPLRVVPSNRRTATRAATSPGTPAWVRVARAAPRLVPQELLRRAARAQLRLGAAAPPTSRGATPSTLPARGATSRRSRTSWLSGCAAASRASASTWRSRSSRTTDGQGGDEPRCGGRSAPGSTRTTPTPCSSPRDASRAPAARWRSTPTSSS